MTFEVSPTSSIAAIKLRGLNATGIRVKLKRSKIRYVTSAAPAFSFVETRARIDRSSRTPFPFLASTIRSFEFHFFLSPRRTMFAEKKKRSRLNFPARAHVVELFSRILRESDPFGRGRWGIVAAAVAIVQCPPTRGFRPMTRQPPGCSLSRDEFNARRRRTDGRTDDGEFKRPRAGRPVAPVRPRVRIHPSCPRTVVLARWVGIPKISGPRSP